MTQGPAMTSHECEAAIRVGREAAQAAISGGAAAPSVATAAGATASSACSRCTPRGGSSPHPRCAVAVGELGMGNTTAAAALLAALTGAAPADVCGRGTGACVAGGVRGASVAGGV